MLLLRRRYVHIDRTSCCNCNYRDFDCPLGPSRAKGAEAAARTQCTNNLKQWGLGMQSCHDTNKALPIGATNTPRSTWVPYLWPYIDQTQVLAAYGNVVTQQFYQPPAVVQNTFNGVVCTRIQLYYCPSDRPGGDVDGTRIGDPAATMSSVGGLAPSMAPPVAAVFGVRNGNMADPLRTKLVTITDGTSNTLMMSEIIVDLVTATLSRTATFSMMTPCRRVPCS